MFELDLVQDRTDHICIILVINCRKQQRKRILLLKMRCCLHEFGNSILIMCTVYDYARQYSFHSSLPACFKKSLLYCIRRYRNDVLQHFDRFEGKRTVHHLINSNKRNGKYCVIIILILK